MQSARIARIAPELNIGWKPSDYAPNRCNSCVGNISVQMTHLRKTNVYLIQFFFASYCKNDVFYIETKWHQAHWQCAKLSLHIPMYGKLNVRHIACQMATGVLDATCYVNNFVQWILGLRADGDDVCVYAYNFLK